MLYCNVGAAEMTWRPTQGVYRHEVVAGEPQSPVSHDTDQQTSDACDICAVVALANATLLATPPLLLLPQAIEFLYLATDAEFAHLDSARNAFQPRAPPV